MKITDFKFGDRIKRKGWDTYTELDLDFHYKLDLGMIELLSDDWEKEPKKVKKEGWINLYKTATGATWASAVYDTKEEANNVRYIKVTTKIEWEEEE